MRTLKGRTRARREQGGNMPSFITQQTADNGPGWIAESRVRRGRMQRRVECGGDLDNAEEVKVFSRSKQSP